MESGGYLVCCRVGHAAVAPLPSFLVDGPACATPHIIFLWEDLISG